ncbi:hypothetical protein M9Y10_044488 [Tritrichomonas musculus]|uniref:Uncharacterized protein n=1 Tax=Tritrichomonas musculus TaxID=1915356 RepID=A0ABR2JUD0_9EUKA
MKSEIETLSAELKQLQSGNIELYEKLANLKKEKSELQKSKDEEVSDINIKIQIEAILEEQKKERAKRNSAQKTLESLVNDLKGIQNEIDAQKSIIQNSLMPVMCAEEEMTNQFYKDILNKCKEKPPTATNNFQKVEQLISQISKKSKEYIESQDEIEKYSRLIVINENPIPKASKLNSLLQFSDTLYIVNNEARRKRKNFFKLNFV